jgi:CheY-like chemotaxis protein
MVKTLTPDPARLFAVSRILVVDDDADVAELVEIVLRAEGHDVETVHSGQVALERLTAATYELVICDLHMPGVHGQAVYETIRNRPAPHPVVLFMSGYHATHEKYEAFLRETGLPLLAKPFTVETLRQNVRRLLAARGSSG